MRWKPEDAGVFLWPNPFFLPKVLSAQALNQVMGQSAVMIESSESQGDVDVELPCPVRALQAYVDRIWTLRGETSQLFVCFGQGKLGRVVRGREQWLSHWLVDTIAEAYGVQNFPVMAKLVGHSSASGSSSLRDLCGCNVVFAVHFRSFS